MFSGNYHWSTPLVSLPGRGGLDLNLSLHYNSLQWVRYGNTMYYDPDSYVTLPTGLTTGFNLGFPEIEPGYSYDGVYSYVVTLPSGYRVPMRRVIGGGSAKYEATDGLYMYLKMGGTAILYMPDGTQYSYGDYSYVSGSYRCSQVKDSNGNRINIAYGTYGISTITDTLGRVLTFSYDPTYGHLLQITQNWMGQPRVLAQFDYDLRTLSYNFGGLTVDAPANNSQVSVLTRVITSDRARHVFVYNGWGIVDDIFLYGALDNQRAALDYVFPVTTTALSDAPRFSERNDGIWGFTGQWNTNLGWVANSFQFDPNETWGKVRTPDGVVHVEQFSASGNTRGLSTGMETWTGTSNWAGGVRRKWTTTNWISDSTNKPLYPRVTETNIYDDADGNGTADNRRRAGVSYTTFTKTPAQSTMPYTVHLPFQSTEYAADASTVYRTSQTDYLDDNTYWTRWIIGLPTQQRLYNGGGTLQAQTGSGYDEATCLTHTSAVLQHDTANYGTSLYPRGNQTSTQRYSVANGTASSPTQTLATYYLTGNVATARDALNHETKFFYDDAFASYTDAGNNTETETTYNLATKSWAYPTQVQDPDNFSSSIKYWYDTGAPTRTTDPKGAAAISIYETTYGHLTKSKNLVNSSYTKYFYDTGQTWVQTWSTINDTTESAVLSLLDGVGRERQRVDEHPGSTGTLSSSYRIYDLMGRVVEWSNPTEISSNSWLPVGDDTAYVYSRQDYDWKHRPTITYNQDYNASTNPSSKRTISYEGCGCAGSAITTVTDEMQRTRKSYADFLGRAYKTEIMNGAATYSSTITTFNVRDQASQVQELANAGSVSQNSYLTYDGYGRLETSRKPIESQVNTYQYNADDTVWRMTDARGAITTYGYNARHLPTSISYSAGSSGATTTNGVTFEYNELGQRTIMDDGPGVVNYYYNQLGRMTSERRTFDLAGAPTTPFTITYDEYNLAGQIKKIKDPFNDEIVNSYDKVGRLLTVTGTAAFAGVTTYQNTLSYRAWGGIKNGRTYDGRMRMTAFGSTSYGYDLSSKLTSAQMNSGAPYHQAFSYDHAGRLTGVSTPEIDAPSQFIWTQSSPPNGLYPGFKVRPFVESISYDEFGNVTERNNKYWFDWQATGHQEQNFQTTYLNNRAHKDNVAGRVQNNQTETWTYDNAGEIVNDSRNSKQYDVAGRQVKTQSVSNANIYANSTYDGDGRPVKYEQKRADGSTEIRYRLYSTVLGKLLTDIDPAGQKLETRVYGVDSTLVRQVKAYTVNVGGGPVSYPDTVVFEGSDPHGTLATVWDRDTNSYKTMNTTPGGTPIETINFQLLRDRFVNGIAGYVAYAQTASARYSSSYSSLSDPQNPGSGCQLDGQSISCAKLIREARHGRIGDATVYHAAGGIQGDGYGGGYGYDEEGNQEGDLIAGGDINGDLVVDIGGSGEETSLFEKCKNLAPGPVTEEKVNMILNASQSANVNATLLAATWQLESFLTLYPKTNPNDGKRGNADVGPVQINYNTFSKWSGIADLYSRDVFGFTPDPLNYDPDEFSSSKDIPYSTVQFNGNPNVNLVAGGRILSSYGGTPGSSGKKRSDAAGYYRTGKGDFLKTPDGQKAFNGRKGDFDKIAPKWDQFFNCLNGK